MSHKPNRIAVLEAAEVDHRSRIAKLEEERHQLLTRIRALERDSHPSVALDLDNEIAKWIRNHTHLEFNL